MMSTFYKSVTAGMVLVAMMLVAGKVSADTSIQTATVQATIASAAGLSIGANTVTFPSMNPTTTPSVPASENGLAVNVNARTSVTGTVLLTVIATSDLTSGSNTIPISDVTYTATGTGFQGGTLSKVAAQTMGSWTGSGSHSCTLNYFLANSYTYVPGTYNTTLTYTLVAP